MDINYDDLNEEFGNANVSEEEDDIEKEAAEKKKAKVTTSKYERVIRFGKSRKVEILGFPNYFTSQKVRVNVSNHDEARGKKTFLNRAAKAENVKSKSKPTKKGGRAKSSKK